MALSKEQIVSMCVEYAKMLERFQAVFKLQQKMLAALARPAWSNAALLNDHVRSLRGAELCDGSCRANAKGKAGFARFISFCQGPLCA